MHAAAVQVDPAAIAREAQERGWIPEPIYRAHLVAIRTARAHG
ncbi:MAG: hypothetical protein WAK53_11640 [Chromatiaceae bacterium]